MSAFAYSTVEEMLQRAEERNEEPFLFLLDGLEDPHNLGAIIRTANLAGAHGVIIPRHRAVGLTATVVKASAGAVHYTPVAKVTNLTNEMKRLKERGMWFVCADMEGELMYRHNLTDLRYYAGIPMAGDIDSLNASVAAGVLAYEIVRQRLNA